MYDVAVAILALCVSGLIILSTFAIVRKREADDEYEQYVLKAEAFRKRFK